MAKDKRVALFIMYKNIENSASIVHFIKSLAEEGYTVDIFSPNRYKVISDYGYENINFYAYRYLNREGKFKFKIIKQILNFKQIRRSLLKLNDYVRLHGIKTAIHYAIFLVKDLKFLYLDHIDSIVKNKKYRCVIGIEKGGLIMADLANYNEVPLIYYSLELYYSVPPGIRGFGFRITKELEARAHNNAIVTIIQDKERAKVLFEYNEISEDKQEILYLPVSMLGDSFKEKTDYFYKTLDIPRDKKILLQLGSIGLERMSVEIAKFAQNWPEDWVLVMHGGIDEGTKHKIMELNKKGNIFLSEKKVPFENIPEVVASAHIGLVFYKNLTDYNYYNNYYIGSSSGQLAHYLQCGIPIITLNIPSLRRVVDEFQCGLTVDDVDSIAESAKIIFSNYEFFRENAFKCFEEKYRFAKYFENIRSFIECLN